ncbi:MAG: porin [Alphaproteobacteria bacterium]|nr:porin [Alphaproteobacteria bacterium]
MKKVLLGTSALVAVGLCAGEAAAQGYAGLQGYIRNYGSLFDHGSTTANGARDIMMTSNAEFYVRGETKLNNGMIYGFRMEMEAWTQNGSTSAQGVDNVDEIWAYVKGSFGEIRFGEEDDARKLKAYSTYIGGSSLFFGVDSPDGVYALGTSTTYFNVENDTYKIIYLSPTFAGFSFAASYAPDATKGTRSFAIQADNDCDGTQSRGCNGNAYSVAADYRGKFGDTTIGVDVGYTGSEHETAGRKGVSAWRADAFMQVGGWEASIQYGKANDINGNDLDVSAMGGAIKYSMGPWSVGGFYQQGRTDVAGGGRNKINHFLVGAGYNLGGGVSLGAALSYQKRDNVTGADPTGTTFTFGIGANF